jgi:hypothetical protein
MLNDELRALFGNIKLTEAKKKKEWSEEESNLCLPDGGPRT